MSARLDTLTDALKAGQTERQAAEKQVAECTAALSTANARLMKAKTLEVQRRKALRAWLKANPEKPAP